MADEDASPAEEVVEGAGSKKKLIIIAVVALLVLGSAGFFAFKSFTGGSSSDGGHGEEGASESHGDHGENEHGKEEGHTAKEGDDPASKETADHSGEEGKGESESTPTIPKPSIGNVFEMAAFQVNLADAYQNRYLQMSVALEFLPQKGLKEELSQRRAKIRDTIITMASTQKHRLLMKPEGRMQFRVSLMNTINSYLQKGAIKQLYFTEFIIE